VTFKFYRRAEESFLVPVARRTVDRKRSGFAISYSGEIAVRRDARDRTEIKGNVESIGSTVFAPAMVGRRQQRGQAELSCS
jgi:hypothetical protein